MNVTPVVPMYVMPQEARQQAPVYYAVQDLRPVQPEQEAKPTPKHRGLKAVASTLVPGLGQMFDGRIGTGLAYLGGFLGLRHLAFKHFTKFNKLLDESIVKSRKISQKVAKEPNLKNVSSDAIKKRMKNLSKTPGLYKSLAVLSTIGFAHLGLRIATVVDAYKNAQK